MISSLQALLRSFHFTPLFLVGTLVILSFYFGKTMKYVRLPLIIGYMVFGVVLGPSFLDLFNDTLQQQLSFITEMALGFVALSIGIELSMKILKKQGKGIITVIFAESFGAFFLVLLAVFLLTRDLAVSLIFASVAPASAPAGTVAVIREYKAKGSLTSALYAVVGFDDGLAIMIFGFAAAIARTALLRETGAAAVPLAQLILLPLKEIFLSLIIGYLISLIYCYLLKRLKITNDVLILTFGFVLLSAGLCSMLHLSIILTNMVVGIVIINTQPSSLIQKIHDQLSAVLPLLFVLFFALAGANLHLSSLPSLGLLGIVYIITRSAGLIGGARLGSIIGKTEENIKKYLGLGILSQAGVAIGLSLIIKHDFSGLGKVVDAATGMTSGDRLGSMVLTTVTATCIFFEIIGPILTRYALFKANEIQSA